MKKGRKDSKTVGTEGLCTGNQEHTHSSMYRHTHTSPSTMAASSPTPLGVKTPELNAACLWFLI